jgi:hypothetical protein
VFIMDLSNYDMVLGVSMDVNARGHSVQLQTSLDVL